MQISSNKPLSLCSRSTSSYNPSTLHATVTLQIMLPRGLRTSDAIGQWQMSDWSFHIVDELIWPIPILPGVLSPNSMKQNAQKKKTWLVETSAGAWGQWEVSWKHKSIIRSHLCQVAVNQETFSANLSNWPRTCRQILRCWTNPNFPLLFSCQRVSRVSMSFSGIVFTWQV